MPQPQPPPLCEACRRRPVEEPESYTKCFKCLMKLAHGHIVEHVPQPDLFHSKRRGRTGVGIEYSNQPFFKDE